MGNLTIGNIERLEKKKQETIEELELIKSDKINLSEHAKKLSIKECKAYIKHLDEIIKSYNEIIEIQTNKILDIKNQFAKLGYEVIELENEDYILRKYGTIIENYEDVEHYNIEQLENKLG